MAPGLCPSPPDGCYRKRETLRREDHGPHCLKERGSCPPADLKVTHLQGFSLLTECCVGFMILGRLPVGLAWGGGKVLELFGDEYDDRALGVVAGGRQGWGGRRA